MERGQFEGVIGRDYSESTPWWPEMRRADPATPNVVIIVLDDVGFAQLGCFGSDIDTPVLDGLAAEGLRFTNFHTTSLCSPTRACVLTGRNHHSNGMGRIVELATGFPGYDSRIPKSNGLLSEVLVERGFSTWAVGKWHLTPEDECHEAAPRTRWPLGRGFERFYGFMEGETHQYVPALVADNHQVPPPRRPEDGYHLTEDLVDHALGLVKGLRAVDPDKPFFLYFCPGACHAPHQAPAPWIERYRGAFDGGWDKWRRATLARQLQSGVLPPGTELSPRPDWVPAWDSLSPDARRLYARYMEAFAGFLSHTDHHIGRLLGFLEETGDLDNTMVVVLSDNGASSEGGPTGSVNDVRPWNMAPRTVEEGLARIDEIGGPWCHNNYPWGWTVAGNTPFKRWKRETHEGGVADPLIVRWPGGMRARGETRRQYVHAVDIYPTVLESLGIESPATLGGVEQSPVEGTAFAYCFDDAGVPSRHATQYYEMFGCRAIYHDGWKAVTYHPIQDTRVAFDDDVWELYHVAEDASECRDLAAVQPDKLREMMGLWWEEAERHQVLPLDNRPFSAFVLERPPPVQPRTRYVYYPGASPVPEMVAVNIRNRPHVVRAELEIPGDRAGAGGPAPSPEASGVLVSQGSGLGGWALYMVEGRPAYVHNFVSLEEHHIEADADVPPVTPGRHEVAFAFTRTADHAGTGRLLVDGVEVGEGTIPRFTPMRFSISGAGLTCGYSDGVPVSRRYAAPFEFTGRILRVVIDVDGPPFADPEADAHFALARQ
ncbi:MAG TPA: arylsulfatase [Acidimicrobiales bacterium]|nr:arylsulfatase [Acidimicrobiales bacterium]HLN43521.1 arylsulfatase [Acidimicrobiales bacterium]